MQDAESASADSRYWLAEENDMTLASRSEKDSEISERRSGFPKYETGLTFRNTEVQLELLPL